MVDIQICVPGTIMAAPRMGSDRPDFYEVTAIVSKGTVELRQIVTDENGKPVAGAYVAPPFRASVGITLAPDTHASVWNASAEPSP